LQTPRDPARSLYLIVAADDRRAAIAAALSLFPSSIAIDLVNVDRTGAKSEPEESVSE